LLAPISSHSSAPFYLPACNLAAPDDGEARARILSYPLHLERCDAVSVRILPEYFSGYSHAYFRRVVIPLAGIQVLDPSPVLPGVPYRLDAMGTAEPILFPGFMLEPGEQWAEHQKYLAGSCRVWQ
jgi:hypothetical protein